MNIYEPHEHGFGALVSSGKKACFFLLEPMEKAVLGSFLFIKFINSVMRSIVTVWRPDFMNFMKFYELGLINGAFSNRLLSGVGFMNIVKWQTS